MYGTEEAFRSVRKFKFICIIRESRCDTLIEFIRVSINKSYNLKCYEVFMFYVYVLFMVPNFITS